MSEPNIITAVTQYTPPGGLTEQHWIAFVATGLDPEPDAIIGYGDTHDAAVADWFAQQQALAPKRQWWKLWEWLHVLH